MTTKNKNTGNANVKKEPIKPTTAKPVKTKVKKPKPVALQKALNVINSYRANIHKNKKKDYDKKNKKGFNNADDELFFKNLHNMWLEPYTENEVLDKNFKFGEGVIVFKDGQKYTVKKEDDRLIIAN